MVAQDGHSSVGPVVGQDLGRNVFLRCREERNAESGPDESPVLSSFTRAFNQGLTLKRGVTQERTARQLLQLRLQGDRGVVSTENFGRQAIHQLLEVLVENRSLEEEHVTETKAALRRPGLTPEAVSLTLRRSNRSSSGSLFSMNN